MRTATLLLLTLFLMASCQQTTKKKTANTDTTMEENTPKWTLLFDGTSFDGWHQFNKETMSSAWRIEDEAMIFDPTAKAKDDGGHDIVTDREFTNFELSLEWNISEGGNSGIFWGVKEGEAYGAPYATGPEIQVLDNARHPDANANPKYHQAGALYDLVQPSEDVCKPAGEWNHVLLTVNHETNEGRVVLNGVEIVNFPLHGDTWDAMVAKSKFADAYFKDFGMFKTGKISLQDHGDVVAYRNIKIREL